MLNASSSGRHEGCPRFSSLKKRLRRSRVHRAAAKQHKQQEQRQGHTRTGTAAERGLRGIGIAGTEAIAPDESTAQPAKQPKSGASVSPSEPLPLLTLGWGSSHDPFPHVHAHSHTQTHSRTALSRLSPRSCSSGTGHARIRNLRMHTLSAYASDVCLSPLRPSLSKPLSLSGELYYPF